MLFMPHMRNQAYGGCGATFLALLLAGLFGCSASGSTATTPIPGTTDALASELASAFCKSTAGCGVSPDASASDDASVPASSVPDGGSSTCLERATLSATQQLALVSTAFSEGLLTINSEVASACVAAYGSLSCTALGGQSVPDVQAALDNPACANLFTGYIPVGERCDLTYECVAGSYCLSQGNGQNVTSVGGSGTLGVCFLFQATGDACNTTDDCLPPLTCNPTTLTCE